MVSASKSRRHFDAWVKRKDHFERGCKLLAALDDDRAHNAAQWFDVTVALAAIERAIEPSEESDDEEWAHRRGRSQRDMDGSRGSAKSMYEVWRSWTIEKHTFVDVELSREESETLSRALIENAEEDKGGQVVLPTLRYVKPSKPHNRSVLPKPLSSDQLAQNKIFVARCRTEWRSAQREMRVRLGKYLASLDVGPDDREKATSSGLRIFGVAQLAKWVEEDADAIARKKKEDELEREDQAKMTHAGFVKKKNATVVRMREADAQKPARPPPRFDLSTSSLPKAYSTFAGAKSTSKIGGPVRPRYNTASNTTIDLLRGSGMKVVHALDRGSRGLEGDLERCRRKLLEDGYVHPQNFDDPNKIQPARADFDASRIDEVKQRYVEPRLDERRERQQSAKCEFEKWIAAKKGRDEALKCLSVLDPPILVAKRESPDAALAYWRRVGALLKAVDGSLMSNWIAWSQLGTSSNAHASAKGAQSKTQAWGPNNSLASSSSLSESGSGGKVFEWAPASSACVSSAVICWCAFAPRGCDVQRSLSCGGVSPLKAVLLRVLKSGIDFSIPFKRLQKRLERQKENRGQDDEDNMISVGAADMRRCLRDGGLAVSIEEARLIVDAIDNYAGNGKARLEELRSIFGRPIRAGNVSGKLRQISHFEQTCHETGMPNAYRVTANPSKRPTKHEVDIQLKNHEIRRRWTNPDLEKRRLVLRKLGVKVPHRLEDELREDGQTDEYDDDDFGDEDGYDDDFEESSPKKTRKHLHDKKIPLACNKGVYRAWGFDSQPTPLPACSEVAIWGIWGKPRRLALKALRSMSKIGRREERLKEALAEGAPPAAPELWAASLAELEAEGLPFRELTTRLVVRWRPNDASGSDDVPVAFFHLEFSGALGSRAQRENNFTEIVCDPPSAKHDSFAFQHVVSGLEPNTTYVFRARAFNTFGPGPYTWRRLTTPPERPMAPVPVKIGPRAVVLRWKVPEALEKRAAELRRSFEEAAAADDFAQDVAARLNALHETNPCESTAVSSTLPEAENHGLLVRRQVWLALLDEKYRGLLDFLRRAHTSAVALQHAGGDGEMASMTCAGGAKLSLLDELEESDAEVVGWQWVRARLAATSEIEESVDKGSTFGMAKTTTLGPSSRGLVTTGEGARMVSEALERYENGLQPGPDATGEVQRFQQIAAPTTYVIERCISERGGDYDEVLRTRFGEAAVNGLEPNTTYRFRVHTINTDGDVSIPSRSVVINTLLEAPAAPRLALVADNSKKKKLRSMQKQQQVIRGLDGVGGGALPKYVVSSTSVKIAWPRHAAFSSGTDRRADSARKAEQILTRWTNTVADDDGAVSLEAVFAKFDRDRDEAFTLDALPMVLTKLGAHRTHASTASAMRAVWDDLRDAARDVVRTKDFAAWWNSDTVTHVLQRDIGVPKGSQKPVVATGDQAPLVTTYRGTGRTTEVRGLRPNTAYRFSLRLVSSRSHSRPSPPLEVWTAPAPPSAPRIIRAEPKAIYVKWYPGPGGAHKYALESRLVEALDEITPHGNEYFKVSPHLTVAPTRTRAIRHQEGRVTAVSEWKVSYEGKETAVRVTELEPRAIYRFRVRALNGAGHASAPSDLVQAATEDRDPPPLVARKAAEQFTRDCGTTGDVVVGDTILFTERLFLDLSANKLIGEPARGGLPQQSSAHANGTSSINTCSTTLIKQEDGHHVGDRTIAGHVVAEAYYPSLLNRKKGEKSRDLRIQVVWCTTSTHVASSFHLRNGEVIQRLASHVTQFQTFRTLWEDEEHRRSHADELASRGMV